MSDICDTVESWLPDSGATAHMTFDPQLVQNEKVYNGKDRVIIGNGMALSITHIGHYNLKLSNCILHLENVLLVPQLKKTLLSIPQLVRDNPCVVSFSSFGFLIQTLSGQLLHHIPLSM